MALGFARVTSLLVSKWTSKIFNTNAATDLFWGSLKLVIHGFLLTMDDCMTIKYPRPKTTASFADCGWQGRPTHFPALPWSIGSLAPGCFKAASHKSATACYEWQGDVTGLRNFASAGYICWTFFQSLSYLAWSLKHTVLSEIVVSLIPINDHCFPCIHIYVYIYVCMYIYMYIYIYIHS